MNKPHQIICHIAATYAQEDITKAYPHPMPIRRGSSEKLRGKKSCVGLLWIFHLRSPKMGTQKGKLGVF
jgi:hypothetical protein